MAHLTTEPRILLYTGHGRGITRRARTRHPRPVQRQVLNVTAFKSQDETISISFNGYNLLQVNRAASKESCSKKYDEMVNNPPNCGYSQETLYSRAVVLKSATEAVMDLTAMPSYRQQPGQLAIELLYSDLPGALALLQEAGELQTVLDWGGAWLRDNAADSKTKDVALALALAHCDTAAMQMEENPSDTLRAIEEMTTALHLLRQHAAGLQLQQEIKGALQELEPKAALQQVSLPAETNGDKRAAAIATLSHLVWTANKSRLGMEKAEFMRAVRDNLTAAEQIELYERAGEGLKLSSEDQYDTALAYLAEGFCSRWPQHVQTAHKLLAELQKNSEAGKASTDLDVSVELAVCCLLLGDSEKAEDVLRLGPGSTTEQADPAIRSFVLEACPSPDDLLPGLCALAERWLADVALPGFRDAPSDKGSLADWFDDRRVSLYLQVLDNGRRLHLGEAAEATRSALSGIIKNVTSALKLPFQGGQHGAGGPPVDLSDEPQIQTSGPSMQPLTSQPQADALPAGTSIRVSVRAPSDADAKPMESRLADALVAGTDLATKQLPNPASNDLLDEDMAPISRALPSRSGPNRVSLQGPIGITDGIVQFAGEREMWASFQDANLRKRRRVKAMIAGAAVLVAALALRAFQQHRSTMTGSPVTANPLQAVSQVLHQASGTLTDASAKQLLLQWQDVKADALGVNHAANRLPSVLDGELLASWRAQAEEVQAENKHWEYDLNKLEIISVDMAEDEASGSILAAVQEDASLFEDAELVHVYKGTFTSEYRIVKTQDGWKFTRNNITF